MGGSFDASAEVFGRGDDTLAEIFLPNAINDDASGRGATLLSWTQSIGASPSAWASG